MKHLKEFDKFIHKKSDEIDLNKNVWLYTRVSSKDQYVNQSLENQKKYGIEYCVKNEYILSKTFGETYESARGDFTRREFKSLIESVKRSRRRPFAILLYKMSRFSRTGGHAISLATELIEVLGVHLIEVSSGKSTLTERGKLEIYERLLKAREENIERLEMTVPGMTSFVENGNWLGRVPRGYDHFGPRVKDTTKISGEQKIVINGEGKILKEAWKKKALGSKDSEILIFLREKGVNFTKQALSRMWRKPFYCGIIVHNMLGEKVVKGNHQALVSQKDFLKINRDLERNKKGYDSSNDEENLPLNNFVRSLDCGTSYSGYCVRKKGLYYYKNNRTGSRENIRAEKLHESFVDLLREIELDKAIDADLLALAIRDKIQDIYKVDVESQELIKKRVLEIDSRLTSLKRKYMVLDLISKEDYDLFKAELDQEKAQLLKDSENTISEFSNLQEIISKGVRISQNISILWLKSGFQLKKALQNVIFPEGILFDFKNKVSRTQRVNEIFQLNYSISMSYCKKPKRTSLKFETCPMIVAGGGLESHRRPGSDLRAHNLTSFDNLNFWDGCEYRLKQQKKANFSS
ncbi:MAG: recombinase family protein [Cytophagales bacterium]|nr:recombinase family protein [Cytophagales bacterium]